MGQRQEREVPSRDPARVHWVVMSDSLALFNEFVDAEVAARHATWSEADDVSYYGVLGGLLRLVALPLKESFTPSGRRAAKMERCSGPKVKRKVADIRRRTIFSIDTWTDPQHGTLATGYLGTDSARADDGISERFHLSLDLEPPRIIGWESLCSACQGTGCGPDAPCKHCKGVGFQTQRHSVPLIKGSRA